jgi:hypothetical protein
MKNSGTKLVIICLFRVLGLLQQLRYQEEGRAGACGQVQPINPAVSSWVLRPPFHRAVGTTKKSPPPVNCSPSPSRFSTIGGARPAKNKTACTAYHTRLCFRFSAYAADENGGVGGERRWRRSGGALHRLLPC